uniref:Late secretory pathway protein AVL9 n=1 Tax=Aceria tosichella TaxID=561515 RepID=A0A6G1SHE9_9ACAR
MDHTINDGPCSFSGERGSSELSDSHHQDQSQPTSPQPPDENRIVRHIMVIGFHHKHGYQVDYCYPPLEPGGPVFTTPSNPITLPSCWKTLPLLCLPDGSHNYDSDAIYFTMPDVINDTGRCGVPQDGSNASNSTPVNESATNNHQDGIKTIFGTACYRQIHVEKLLNRTDDMTRVAVQKSVCVLSTQPLFGLVRSKLEMITHAYFEELDFSKVRILKLTYDNLNSLLARDSVRENAAFLGLSARQLVSYFGNNMLVLFKAMLLEKKILFYKSPVKDLCSTIMSMCSLFNGLIESGGLNHSTCDLQLSPTLLEALKLEPKSPTDDLEANSHREGKVFFSPSKEEVVIINNSSFNETFCEEMDERSPTTNDVMMADLKNSTKNANEESNREEEFEKTGEYELIEEPDTTAERSSKPEVTEDESFSSLDETIIDDQYAHKLCQLKPEDCGLPLQIFTRGSFCLPYLSISYLDLLSDKRVRSFVIGATNFLFKQRREMYDVIVDMEENSIIISDTNLKKLLNLTIEDLRFMDYLSKHVKLEGGTMKTANNSESLMFDPINHDVTKWLGGDEWIRYHFKIYTLYLLKAAKSQTNLDTFNSGFVHAWKFNTNNYRIWDSTGKSSILNDLQSRHPFSSTARGMNFSDMKLKLSYAVNSSDKGRMVNQTLNGIGKWSLWNNIATASNMAASTVSSIASSATTAASTVINPIVSDDNSGASDTNQRQQSSNEKATDGIARVHNV